MEITQASLAWINVGSIKVLHLMRVSPKTCLFYFFRNMSVLIEQTTSGSLRYWKCCTAPPKSFCNPPPVFPGAPVGKSQVSSIGRGMGASTRAPDCWFGRCFHLNFMRRWPNSLGCSWLLGSEGGMSKSPGRVGGEGWGWYRGRCASSQRRGAETGREREAAGVLLGKTGGRF